MKFKELVSRLADMEMDVSMGEDGIVILSTDRNILTREPWRRPNPVPIIRIDSKHLGILSVVDSSGYNLFKKLEFSDQEILDVMELAYRFSRTPIDEREYERSYNVIAIPETDSSRKFVWRPALGGGFEPVEVVSKEEDFFMNDLELAEFRSWVKNVGDMNHIIHYSMRTRYDIEHDYSVKKDLTSTRNKYLGKAKGDSNGN